MSAFGRRRRTGRRHLRATIWTLLVALATAVTLLLLIAMIVLVATAPNWVGR
jgi:hypothetical protein